MITFNGTDLRNVIEVSSIKGRGPLSQDINRISVPVRDGSYYLRKRIPERQIEVAVEIVGNSLIDIRTKIDALTDILNVENPASIVFLDEPNVVYYGIVLGQPNWDEYLFIGKGTLTFICLDPYKYKMTESVTPNNLINANVSSLESINYNGRSETPLLITSTFTGTGNNFEVTNQAGRKIKVIRSFIAGDKLEIDTAKLAVKLNGAFIMPSLDIQTSRKFYLEKGLNELTILSGANTSVVCSYRERGL